MHRTHVPWWAAITAGVASSVGSTAFALNGIDLSQYRRVARYPLPEPTTVTPPPGSLLAKEASAVTYNWDTDTLFVVGDTGTAVVQVSKTGQYIDSMTLAAGPSPQGTFFYDPEGLAYTGNGRFVMAEERYRVVNQFSYAAGTTLGAGGPFKAVKIGTTIGNVGIEGITNDPQTGGYVAVKEASPQGIFQTTIDFDAGTASNGSPTTVNSLNLFDPALLGLADLADVFSLSNLSTLTGPDSANLLVLSQESGRIVETDRSGNILSSLTITADPTDPLSVADMQHEGLAMDNDGVLYVVSENGGGSIDRPELWVYQVPEPASAALAGAAGALLFRRLRHR
jgi:hypothetical protein